MAISEDKAFLIYTHLKEVFLLLDHGDRNLFQDFDLSVARFNALMHLNNETDIGPTELGNKMLCDKANITRLLDGMEASSYIERAQDESDGRRIQIKVKPEGERQWREAREVHRKATSQRFEVLSPEEQDTLLELLPLVSSNLQRQINGDQPRRSV